MPNGTITNPYTRWRNSIVRRPCTYTAKYRKGTGRVTIDVTTSDSIRDRTQTFATDPYELIGAVVAQLNTVAVQDLANRVDDLRYLRNRLDLLLQSVDATGTDPRYAEMTAAIKAEQSERVRVEECSPDFVPDGWEVTDALG